MKRCALILVILAVSQLACLEVTGWVQLQVIVTGHGQPVAGADVTVSAEGQSLQGTTDAAGSVTFDVPVGWWIDVHAVALAQSGSDYFGYVICDGGVQADESTTYTLACF